jgi:Spy/CpxP family protein refolding chaperone
MIKQTLPVVLCVLGCCFTDTTFAQRRDDRRPQRYSIEQAVSDQAQLHTIAFNGLAFVTGDFGASTFLPPGTVCDYFGFQYMRDIDAQEKGHNPMFLGRVAGNVLKTLDDDQRQILSDLAKQQAPRFNDLAMMRLPMIKAFHRQLDGDIPKGSEGLNEDAVVMHVGEIFALDAELSYQRAQAYGRIIESLTPGQKDYFAKMKFGDFGSWPEVDGNQYRMPRGTEKMVNVAYMTYASEFFSWYAGSVEADVYFCPERHGTYFGGFYMKDMPAMGKRDYDISTSLTGDSGKAFIDMLNSDQRQKITSIPDRQRKAMQQIIALRRSTSQELRKFINGANVDDQKVLELGRQYGVLDGTVSFYYATAFAEVGRSLTPQQLERAMKLRNLIGYTSAPAYLYSTPMKQSPDVASSEQFFFAPKARGAQ